jgi:Neuraminidase (sialidase)
MTGRAAVHQLRSRLDPTFERISDLDAPSEVMADFAQYLRVLVSGLVEASARAVLLEVAGREASPSVLRHVEGSLQGVSSLNSRQLNDDDAAGRVGRRRPSAAACTGRHNLAP